MKKRLRKKKHLREFKEFGWYVDYELSERSQEAEFEFLDLLFDKVESLGLMIGGSTTSFFAHSLTHSSATIAQEKSHQLHNWLQQQPGVTDVTSSPLTDAWYGPFQD